MIDLLEGRIFKGIGGFYYVDTDAGVYTCKARGLFRKDGVVPCVGDWVSVRVSEEAGEIGTVEHIHPRRNFLVRPPVANVDCVVVVIAVKKPLPNFLLVDKVLSICEKQDISVKLCVNKEDLCSVDDILEIYRPTGYEIYVTSAQSGAGVSELVDAISGQVTVFAGNSGVGKSSLINVINKDYTLETGDVSKIERGRHTTRHVEFYKLKGGGYVADTPGFSKLDLYDIKKDELARLFPEFRPYLGDCRFNDCSHTKEVGCAVIKAVQGGAVHSVRHENYRQFYEERKQKKEWEEN